MTKERLRHYLALKREEEQLRQQLETIETSLQSPKVQKLTGMPPGGAEGYRIEELLAKHLDLQTTYGQKLEELAAEQLAIESAVAALPPKLRMLIRLHYFEGCTWNQVCERMNYSWTSVHRLHRAALQILREQEDEKCE